MDLSYSSSKVAVTSRPKQENLTSEQLIATETPFVSFIVPFRDEDNNLLKCVTSILNIDYPQDKFEVILADNKSSDQSLAIAQDLASRHPKTIRIVCNDDLDGPGPTVNVAVKDARGSICARVDADSTIRQDYLRQALRNFYDPEIAAVYPRIDVHSTKDRSLLFEQDAPVDGHGLPIFKREVFENLGGYDTRFFNRLNLMGRSLDLYFREDTDLLLSMVDKGYKVIQEPNSVAYHDPYPVDTSLLVKWGLNHMMDPLLFKKHPRTAGKEIGILMPPFTRWTLAFFFATISVGTLVASILTLRSISIPIGIIILAEYLLVLSRYRKRSFRRMISPFAVYLFCLFSFIGRVYGSLRFRRLLL